MQQHTDDVVGGVKGFCSKFHTISSSEKNFEDC